MAERKMKDDGIKWIGEIPNEWIICKLKAVVDVNRGGSPRPIEKYLTDDVKGYNWIKIGDATGKGRYISSTKQKIRPDGLSKTRYVTPGTLLLTNSMSFGHPYILQIDGCIHDGWLSFSNYKNITQDFLYYYLESKSTMIQFTTSVDGSVVQNLNIIKVKNALICYPCIDMQNKIVKYLDHKCSSIDSCISNIQKQIENLEEYRKSIITQAVTKGLDPNVEMKDSGVEWIGEIPKRWHAGKMRNIADLSHPYPIGDGDHGLIKSTDYQTSGIPYIRVSNLTWGYGLDLGDIVYISEDMNNKIKNSELHPNDILVAKTGATVGKTAMIPSNMPVANTTAHVGKITVSASDNPGFYYYVLQSDPVQHKIMHKASFQATRPELGNDGLINLIIPIATKEEERPIVEFLDQKCSSINSSIEKQRSLIDKLMEYKQSLIYNAVTGKIDVTEKTR